MQGRNIVKGIAGAAGMAALILIAANGVVVRAQGGAALSGVVSSQEEGKMEGVLVTARRDGANFDVTVVSDAQGNYSFPRTHLQPGKYAVKIRAVGYDLASPAVTDVPAGKTATLDVKLQKTKDITKQLTSVEWLMSISATEEQKALVQRPMESCTYCHNLEIVIKSKHTAEQFPAVITRMLKSYPDGSSYGIYERRGRYKMDFEPELKRAEGPDWGYWPSVKKTELGLALAAINMSGGKSLPAEFKTLPRPKGKATRVIITQYDMPRKDTQSHDSDIDSQGRLWYTDQSAPFLGMFDSKTGTFTEYPMPVSTKHPLTGGSDIQVDKDDNPWFPMVHDSVDNHFGLMHKFDAKTKEFIPAKMPPKASYQFVTIGPDGKIWTGLGSFYRIDPKTMEVDWTGGWAGSPALPPGKPHGIGYDLAVDSDGNPWKLDYSGDGLIKVDVNTKEVTFIKTPTEISAPRRGTGDSEGRIWFGEYVGDKLGMLDVKSGKITEFDPGIKWFGAYTGSKPDKKGRAYAPSNSSDRIMRADPKTGEVVVYLMPVQDFDTKQMSIDPISGALMFVNTRNARVVKMEPLD